MGRLRWSALGLRTAINRIKMDGCVPSRLLNARVVFLCSAALLSTILVPFAISVAAGHPSLGAYGKPYAGDFAAKITGGHIALAGDVRDLYSLEVQTNVQHSLLRIKDPNAGIMA